MIRTTDLSRNDSVYATVTARAKNDGYYLTLNNLEDSPIVILFNCGVNIGDTVLVTIEKISDDHNYIRTSLDSVVCESRMCA